MRAVGRRGRETNYSSGARTWTLVTENAGAALVRRGRKMALKSGQPKILVSKPTYLGQEVRFIMFTKE